jgi:peroxiredoxin
MARTPSNMLPLGTIAPDFELLDIVTDTTRSYEDIAGAEATLVMFICNHCPFVKHIEDELINITNEYVLQGVGVVAISSNDIEKYPQDAPEKMKELAEEKGYPFPYLFDATQDIAKAYHAACTPDFYIFDKEKKLVYRGQLDDSRPGTDIPVSGKDIRNALDRILGGDIPDPNQKPSLGCNIKWKEH